MAAAKPSLTADKLKQAALQLDADSAAEQLLKLIPEDQEVDWVLIGEGSHGTHEYYQLRADITKLLIERRGFNAVATEADWPDAFRANLWVQHLSDQDASAEEALSDFKRFPLWMWRNRDVTNFLQWLHDRNGRVPPDEMRARGVGFYGLDLYSLHTSADYVIRFLGKIDPEAAKRAKERYGCFVKYGEDAVDYAFGVAMGGSPCEQQAVKELKEVLQKVADHRPKVKGDLGKEEVAFAAAANANVVKDAERYYRNMFFKDELTWNIRDTHMADTAGMLANHLKSRGIKRPKIVVWAHNSHLGDARFTDMGKRRGEINLGQLTRERYGEEKAFLLGQLGFTGTVAAADEWGAPVTLKNVNPAMPGSHERLMHETGLPLLALGLRGVPAELQDALAGDPHLERAIGVIYRSTKRGMTLADVLHRVPVPAFHIPENESTYVERRSHYFAAWLGRQFDGVVFWERTRAVEPLDPGKGTLGGEEEEAEPPDTYPFGQ